MGVAPNMILRGEVPRLSCFFEDVSLRHLF